MCSLVLGCLSHLCTRVRQNIINGTEPIEADDLCNLCFANEWMDSKEELTGFMCNDLLVSVCELLIQG